MTDAHNPHDSPCRMPPGRRLAAVRFTDVKPRRLSWLWPGYLLEGELTLLCGDPGVSKSLLTIDWGARVSKGASWPDPRRNRKGKG